MCGLSLCVQEVPCVVVNKANMASSRPFQSIPSLPWSLGVSKVVPSQCRSLRGFGQINMSPTLGWLTGDHRSHTTPPHTQTFWGRQCEPRCATWYTWTLTLALSLTPSVFLVHARYPTLLPRIPTASPLCVSGTPTLPSSSPTFSSLCALCPCLTL